MFEQSRLETEMRLHFMQLPSRLIHHMTIVLHTESGIYQLERESHQF